MAIILAGIRSLVHHIHHMKTQPEDYRPARCPHCGSGGLWHHGHYERKANRRCLGRETDEPTLIPRFRCIPCGKTCSCLPEAIPPRRHYLWGIQQLAILLMLTGVSLNQASQMLPPSRHTLRRWWQRLQQRFSLHQFHLRNRFPELGRSIDIRAFWLRCLRRMPLSNAMILNHLNGVIVP